jgi:hypothetical protein
MYYIKGRILRFAQNRAFRGCAIAPAMAFGRVALRAPSNPLRIFTNCKLSEL